MRKVILAVLLLSCSGFAQFSSGTAKRIIQGTPKPATCAVGDVWVDTTASPATTFNCLIANTWTAVGGAGTTINATNNVLPKRSSATAFVDSSLSDNGTTVATTEAMNAASFATAGATTASVVDYAQGPTNAGAAPCTIANSICEQAPGSVTSYVKNKAGVAPVNNNSAEIYSNASPAVGAWAKMPQIAIISGTAYTNATTTFSNVVGSAGQTLQFSVEASTNYVLDCQILWSASVATAGPKFQFTGPASPTAVQYGLIQAITATTEGSAGATAFSTSLNASGATVVATTNEPAELSLGLVNGSNAGTVTLQAAAQGVGTLTIQPGSFCRLQ